MNLRPLPPQGSTLPSCATSRKILYNGDYAYYNFFLFNFQCRRGTLPTSRKTILNCFARHSVTSRFFCITATTPITLVSYLVFKMVGMTGFEPAAPTSRTWCATKLRYIPKFIYLPKTLVLGGCATPLTKQYSIVLFGRVLHPEVYIFTQNSRFGWVRYPSHKTILNCFVRQSATSWSLLYLTKISVLAGCTALDLTYLITLSARASLTFICKVNSSTNPNLYQVKK